MCKTNINTEIGEYGQFKAHMIIGYENRKNCMSKMIKKAHLHAPFDDTMDANIKFRLTQYILNTNNTITEKMGSLRGWVIKIFE